jgi:hypothetical protein
MHFLFKPRFGAWVSLVMLLTLIIPAVPLSGQPTMIHAQDGPTPDEACEAADIQEPETRDYTEPEQVLEEGVNFLHRSWCNLC